MGLRPLPPTPESGVVCNKCNDGVQKVQIILHQIHKFAFGKGTEAKNQLRVIRKAFRTAEAEISNSEWTLATRKSLPRAPNGPPGESKMSPGTLPDAHPEHVKAPSAATEPLAGARCQKTSIFLRETIDSRRRVGPSRPRISLSFVHLGMPSPLSPNLFFQSSLPHTLLISHLPSDPHAAPLGPGVGGLNGLAPTAADPGERSCLQQV